MSLPVVISAPGRMIIHGEHAAMFGKKAIAAGIALRVTVTLKPSDEFKFKFKALETHSLYNMDTIQELKDELRGDFNYIALNENERIPVYDDVIIALRKFVEENVKFNVIKGDRYEDMSEKQRQLFKVAQKDAFTAALFLYLAICDEPIGLHILVDTEIPVSAGLGASAAFGTALATALLVATEKIPGDKLDKELINRWALASETIIHGSVAGKGVDNTLSTYGGGVIYQKNKDIELIEDFPELRVFIVSTGYYRNPLTFQKKLVKLRETEPDQFNAKIDGIGEIVKSAIRELKENKKLAYSLIQKNHEYIKTLDLTHWLTDFVTEISTRQGFAAKVAGTRGDASIFIYIPSDVSKDSISNIRREIEKIKLPLFDTTLGGPGVLKC